MCTGKWKLPPSQSFSEGEDDVNKSSQTRLLSNIACQGAKGLA